MSARKRTASQAQLPDVQLNKSPRSIAVLSRTSSATPEMDEPAVPRYGFRSVLNGLTGLWPFASVVQVFSLERTALPTFIPTKPTLAIAPVARQSDAVRPPQETPKRKANNSPTNLFASSSSSSSMSSRLPAASSLGSSFSSGVGSQSFPLRQSQTSTSDLRFLDSHQHEAIQRILENNRTRSSGYGVQKRYRRPHIYQHEHKQSVKEALARTLYELQVGKGYTSDFETFKGYMQKKRRLDNLARAGAIQGPYRRTSQISVLPEDEVQYLKKAIAKATKSLQSPKPPKPFSPSFDQLNALIQSRSERAHDRLHPKAKPLPQRLPPGELKEVDALLRKRGVVSKAGREQVSDKDLLRLKPGTWLNDELINFYGQLIVDRAEEAESAKENVQNKPLKVHYFSTFFWTKLRDSGYEKGRIAKWTKKVDIFSKDVVLMAINHGNSHWTSAAINFKAKRVEAYDSMGYRRDEVFSTLRSYLNEEHKNKKKKPFDFTGWADYHSESYPTQENGFDCGVFTCQSLEYISRGADFNFEQKNMPYLRQRMMLEIGRGKLYATG